MSFTFSPGGAGGRRRRPSLTPMIDVVFLLLIFFMLAAQIGRDAALPLAAGGGGAGYAGPPRLVEVAPDGVSVNGVAIAEAELAERLAALTERASDVIVLRPDGGASVQRLIDVAERLTAAGFASLALVE